MRKIAIVALDLAFGIGLLLFSTTILAAPLPLKSYQASYAVYYDGIRIGTTTSTLTLHQEHYQFCTEDLPTLSWLKGKVLECSNGFLTSDKVIPETYTYNYQYGKTKKNITIRFDWHKYLATTTADNKPWRMKIQPDTQDKLSYQLALRQALIQGKKQMTYPVADGGQLKNYIFKVIAHPILTSAFGKLDTAQIIRLPTADKPLVNLWFAKSLRYLPVQAEQKPHFLDVGRAEIISVRN